MDWHGLFATQEPLPELIARGTLVFLALLAMMRVVGQREAGGLGLTDLLVVVLVAQAVSGGLASDSTSVTDGLVVVAVILAWSLVIDALGYRYPRFAAVVKARPRVLVDRGRINHRALRRELMTEDELASQLRLHGVEDLDEVARVHLEPNGMVSVTRRLREVPDGPPDPAHRS